MSVRLAAVQDTPVFLDRDATVDRACKRIAEAGAEGARIIVFPETFIPCYPVWIWELAGGEHELISELHAELLAQSVEVPGPVTDRLGKAAKDAGALVVVGINEPNTDGSGASLYNSFVYLGPEGDLLGVHRKLVPTAPERMVWAPGDGSTLEAVDTPWGRVGGLICWENYMPLARYTMYGQGIEVYVAPTYDEGEPWLSTLRHIAKEGGVWVIGCGTAIHTDDIPDTWTFKEAAFGSESRWINRGDSAIVDPTGEIVAGPAHETREILYAEADPRAGQGARWKLDVAGHYARPDVFELVVNTEARAVLWSSVPPAAVAGRGEDHLHDGHEDDGEPPDEVEPGHGNETADR